MIVDPAAAFSSLQMSELRRKLSDVRIASPCLAGWETMNGNDRVRHCSLCNLNVYNISAISEAEAESLIFQKEGRLCVRLYQRSDGTILTKDCPVGVRAIRRRLAKVAGAVFAALMTIGTSAFSQTSRKEVPKPGELIILERSNLPAHDGSAVIAGEVLDPSEAAVQSATVRLKSLDDRIKRETTTDGTGRFEFRNLTPGEYTINFESVAFTWPKPLIMSVSADQVIQTRAILQFVQDYVMGITSVSGSPNDRSESENGITTSMGTTTIRGDMLRKLPF
jgi:hypothetical protein